MKKKNIYSNLGIFFLSFLLVFAPLLGFAQIDPSELGPDDDVPFEWNNNNNDSNSGGGGGGGGSGGSSGPSANCLSDFRGDKTIGGLFKYVTCIILSAVIPLIFALGIALFLWGVVQYMMNPSDEEKRTKGRQFMLWGIIALTVMFTFWGLVEILGNTFDIDRAFPSLDTTG